MTSEQFWKDDPDLFVSYRKAFINKSKNEIEMYNYKSWLQGVYNHEGNEVTRSRLSYEILNMLGGKGKSPTRTYFEKPIDLTAKKNEKNKTNEQKKEEKRKEYFKEYNSFATMKQGFIEKIKKGE